MKDPLNITHVSDRDEAYWQLYHEAMEKYTCE
jgi:hypothetical protein